MDRDIKRKLDEALEMLRELTCERRRPKRRVSILLFGPQGVVPMSKSINIGATTTATVAYTDNSGNSDPIYSVPAWTATPDGLVTLAPATDGLTCVITGVAAGDATVTATAEGDPQPGTNTITATGTVTVKVAEDTAGTLTFS